MDFFPPTLSVNNLASPVHFTYSRANVSFLTLHHTLTGQRILIGFWFLVKYELLLVTRSWDERRSWYGIEFGPGRPWKVWNFTVWSVIERRPARVGGRGIVSDVGGRSQYQVQGSLERAARLEQFFQGLPLFLTHLRDDSVNERTPASRWHHSRWVFSTRIRCREGSIGKAACLSVSNLSRAFPVHLHPKLVFVGELRSVVATRSCKLQLFNKFSPIKCGV